MHQRKTSNPATSTETEVFFILAQFVSSMNTKLERAVAHDMGPPLKNHICLSRKFFSFIYFLLPQMYFYSYYRATVRLFLLVRAYRQSIQEWIK